jgi:polysaccharide pyruvyl transferase WcaK-like protein
MPVELESEQDPEPPRNTLVGLAGSELASAAEAGVPKVSEIRGRAQAPRIALLTPYDGGNLGDAAIQDAIIANLRARNHDASFSGISLNCDNFAERHGPETFPLCAVGRPFYRMAYGRIADRSTVAGIPLEETSSARGSAARLKQAVKSIPGWGRVLKVAHAWVLSLGKELRHCVSGYSFLRGQDALIVSGGGQLDEEWGGPWGHPYALFKWALLARLARVPVAFASVGACKVTSTPSRLFLSAALRMASYRSYRDSHSREIATGLLKTAAEDPIVPDFAFTLPAASLAVGAANTPIADRQKVVAISPISYAKPQIWPQHNRALHSRYLAQLAQVLSNLILRGYFVVIVWSSLGDDQSVISELLGLLDDDSRQRASTQVNIPTIETWRDYVGAVRDAHILIASRLHSTILGFVTQTPTIAISFDPKVDWVMEDLGMTDYLLQISNFTAEDVLRLFDRFENQQDPILERIASYRDAIAAVSARQYDALAVLAERQSQL